MKKISVGIPAYNCAKYIGQSIESVLNQSYKNLELIVSDNASTDETSCICREWAEIDPRVRYLRQRTNIGVFANYNFVFQQASGEYFKWQSGSDWTDPQFLEACLAVSESHPDVVLAFPRVKLVDSKGAMLSYEEDFSLSQDSAAQRFIVLLSLLQLSNAFNGLIRTESLRKTTLNGIYCGSDIVLLCELALQGKFVLIPQDLWFRRMTAETASKLHTDRQRSEFFVGTEDFDRRPTWKILTGLFQAVKRAQLGSSEKIVCLRYLARRMYWSRARLFEELLHR